MSHRKIWNVLASLQQAQRNQEKQIMRMTTVNLRLRVSDLEDIVKQLQVQFAPATQQDSDLLALIRSVERDVRELTVGEVDHLGQRVAILEEGNRDPDERLLPEETQIQMLGDFILEEIPDEVVLGGAVCNTTINLLKKYRAALIHIGWGGDRDESDFSRMKRMKRTAQDALDAAFEQGDNVV